MATTAFRVVTPYDDDIRLYRWAIDEGETGESVVVAGFPDITVQVVSIIGEPTVIWEGTLGPSDQNGLPAPVFAQCEDPGGTAISFVATVGWETCKQAPYAIRPRVPPAASSAVCFMLATRARR